MKTAVVAIGGNAIIEPGKRLTFENQMRRIDQTSRQLADLIQMGYDIVLTHGNGPQIGNILLQNELSRDEVAEMPLHALVGESQGLIGYMLQQSLSNELARRGIRKIAVSILTQVVVDENDPAFSTPVKPIGKFYKKKHADALAKRFEWIFGYEKDEKAFRRLVPSPEPKGIIEADAIRRFVFGGEEQVEVIIACGGGGIPVVKKGNEYVGVDVVVDKDLAACVLAIDIKERLFIMLTDIDFVYLDYGTERQKPLRNITKEEASKYLDDEQFGEGSMEPKIMAAIRFLENGGEEVIITSLSNLKKSIIEGEGTHITA